MRTVLFFIVLIAASLNAEDLVDKAFLREGAIVGTMIGFGAGHALQGRYLEQGLVFTIGDTMGLATLAAGLGWMFSPVSPHKEYREIKFSDLSPGGFSLMLAGACLLTAFRIWEIVDLWSTYNRETIAIRIRT